MTISRDRLLQLFLGWHAIMLSAAGISLVLLPLDLVNSPTMTTLYSIARPRTWGAVFLFVALLCAFATARVEHWWRPALIGLAAAETGWAIGLTWPLLIPPHRLNVLAPIAWVGIAGIALIIAFAARDRRP